MIYKLMPNITNAKELVFVFTPMPRMTILIAVKKKYIISYQKILRRLDLYLIQEHSFSRHLPTLETNTAFGFRCFPRLCLHLPHNRGLNLDIF